jgi:type VI secretion system protein
MFGGTLPLHVTVEPQANQRSAVAVAVVVVYQRPVLDKLVALSARDWFQNHQQLQRDYPGSFHTWSWEWVPGQDVKDQDLRYESGAKAGVVFADYLTPGAHRAIIDPHKPLRLTLGRTDFTVTPES